MTRRTSSIPTFTPWPCRPGTLNQNLYVASLGHLPFKTTRVRARFAFPAVGLVVAGTGSYRVGTNARVSVSAGTLLSVYPGAVFDYGPDEMWEEYYIGFAGAGAATLVTGGLVPTVSRPRQLTQITPVVSAFKEIIRVWKRARPGDADRACLMAQQLILDVCAGAAAPTKPHGDVIDSVMRECRKRLDEPLDFEQLAEKRGVSYSLLRQRLRDRTGFRLRNI